VAVVAWKGSDHGASGQAGLSGLASDAESFEAFLPREPHAVALGLEALLAKAPLAIATPTPTPFGWFDPVPPNPTPTPLPASYLGCHRWRYALRWEQPSRLAILKNVLGGSVTLYTDFKAPGSGNQEDWPDPIAHSEIAGAWQYTSPSQPTVPVGAYDHDCNDPIKGPACKPGEQPGISYSKGTWDWPDPNSSGLPSSAYDPANPPLYHPGADTTGSCKYTDPVPTVTCVGTGYGTAGTYDGWAWTLNYGYGAALNNDIIYGPDPGPPLKNLMDETVDLNGRDSVPGQTGTPFSFPSTWLTRGLAPPAPGLTIGAQTVTPEPTDPNVIRFGGVNQPSWTKSLPRDVVFNTKDVVNWGLMTFRYGRENLDLPPAFGDVVIAVYKEVVPVVSSDSGDVKAIEASMQLKLNGGLAVDGGTPTKGAIDMADASLTKTWNVDPKKACNRAYGVILCTDGQSNVTNTGSTADTFWDSTATPCAPDKPGTAFSNFPPGAAETMYLNAHQAGSGDAIIRARTFAIGISKDISRCELNRIAYRGRTDANAKKKDAGFALWDPKDPPGVRALEDDRLPHINPSPDIGGKVPPTNESGDVAGGGIDRYGPDQSPADNRDYAFFASDAKALYNAFLAIVRGSASGDYTTSAPVSGAAIGLGNTVVLTSATYPLWQGHIKAIDTSDTTLNPLPTFWDAGDVLTNPSKPWQPTPATRQLYTWNPVTGALIEIIATNAGLINALCGVPCVSTPITSSVIDFMRGNDGSGVKRNWLLGPSINVTPAIVGPAQKYLQSNVVDHKSFEALYAKRRPLAWLGADDGFLHAFDLGDAANPGDGAEVIGLLPPNLIANQITLYNTFLDPDPSVSTDTGQNAGFLFEDHTWGIASSMRFADVWFESLSSYKTVGFLTEGPGGDVVAAIDITHPYGNLLGTPAVPGPGLVPADQNYVATKPVEVLWTKNSSDYAGLFGSWSVPAVAADLNKTSKMTFGAGINPTSLYPLGLNVEKSANIFVVDPTTGTLLSTTAVAPLASPSTSTVVGHQTFTDSILFQTNAAGFQNDNLANLSLQGDENGRVNALYGNWASPKSKVLIDLNAAAGNKPQPLYYSPAANGIGTLGYQVYALGSGSFYEASPTVSGWNVNRDKPIPTGFSSTLPVFVPTLFIATNPYKIGDALFGTVPLGKAPLDLHVISEVVAGIPLQTGPCPGATCDPTYTAGVHTSLGIHTQVTSSPLLVGNAASPTQDVFFTVFDPDFGCNGYSYVLKLEFAISGSGVPTWGPAGSKPTFTATDATTVYAAGAGASSGFVVTDKGAFVGQSGVGKNMATLVKVDIPKPSLPGQPNFTPVWWKEQK
jgi:hypothetical protein